MSCQQSRQEVIEQWLFRCHRSHILENAKLGGPTAKGWAVDLLIT